MGQQCQHEVSQNDVLVVRETAEEHECDVESWMTGIHDKFCTTDINISHFMYLASRRVRCITYPLHHVHRPSSE